jgi:hypothetical protein
MRGVPDWEGSWSDDELERLRAAFRRRFDEVPVRSETLFAVAAEGIRIYLQRRRRADPT